MLKFFFNRFSKVVIAMEIAGILFTAGWIYRWLYESPSLLTKVVMALYVLEYLFLRFCTTKRWYKNADRYEGIELHFKKAMIPTSYMMAAASGVGCFTGSTFLLWPMIVLIGVIAHVNVILLALHYKDKNKTPVNYYSNNKYLTRHVNLGA